MTLIQRFGSALNLNIHFHCLFLDGVYRVNSDRTKGDFQPTREPSLPEIEQVLYKISERTGRYLERSGLLVRDMDQSYLTLDGLELDELQTVQAHSINYRIATGPWRGKKVFTLQTLPPKLEDQGLVNKKLLAKCSGFSLHAGVAAKAHERAKLERLCRYIARPAVSSKRLSLT
ncbi:MAG: transposase, partial [Coxiellaceae bacterium]|nr:transposase [Coxiellaceae bacterium]